MSYSIFWDEIAITIQLLFKLFDIKMILVPHTRSNTKDQMKVDFYFNRFKQDRNFGLIKDPVHASVLINWADIILDIGNSTVFEAVKRQKTSFRIRIFEFNKFYFVKIFLKICCSM